MNKTSIFRQILLVGLSCLSCVAGTKGEKKMEAESWPLKPVEIDFKEDVASMFPIERENSIGLVAGKSEEETLRLMKISDSRVSLYTIPRKKFKPATEKGTCVSNCDEIFMSGNRILRWVNLKQQKEEIVYWGVGDALENQYEQTKLINEKNKIVLSVFSPFYDDKFDKILNNTYSITLEDLINKKRIKSLPISTESGRHLTDKRSMFRSSPNFAFGPDYVVYRESAKYKWLCVNNSLEYIDHPLKDTLNIYKDYFATDYISLEISSTQPYAVAICKEAHKNHFPAIIQWHKAPAVMPVAVPLGKDQDIEYASLQLSPSGRWAYFYTSGYPGAKHYLLYIDTSLPGGCLPPFDIKVSSEDHKATWVTTPEGFVMKVEGKLLYWDLSKFNGNVFLNKQEHDYLQLEKKP